MTRLTPRSLHGETEASLTPHSHTKKICDNTSTWDLLPVLEIGHMIRYWLEFCILVTQIGWKFFCNRTSEQNINWQSISYKINIHLWLFYILSFNGYQLPIFFMSFHSQCLQSLAEQPKNVGLFFLNIFYSVLHIKLLGGSTILSPMYMGRINW